MRLINCDFNLDVTAGQKRKHHATAAPHPYHSLHRPHLSGYQTFATHFTADRSKVPKNTPRKESAISLRNDETIRPKLTVISCVATISYSAIKVKQRKITTALISKR